jgi:hypothetical protein
VTTSRDVDRAEDELTRSLRRLGTPEDLHTVELKVDDAAELETGTRPSRILRDERGRRYFFKSAEAEHIAAEELAHAVRSLGRRPTVATVGRTFDLPGFGPTAGLLQPLIEHEGERLPTDPTAWTPLQVEVLLREHPWEWLLANLDTHVDQFVLVGEARHPFNIDWDHTMADIDVTTLTRFTKRRPTVAPIRNILYDEFARGRVRLDFRGLKREVERVRELDDDQLRGLVRQFARRAGKTSGEAADLAERFIQRKHNLRLTFDSLIATMRRDRFRTRTASGPLGQRALTALHEGWQRFVVQQLHDRVMRAAFKLKKTALTWRIRRGA